MQPVAKAACEPQRFVREFRVAAEGLASRPAAPRRSPRRGQGGRRHRHYQGPGHGGRHEAASFRRPARQSRREEGASPPRLDRHEHRSAPRLQGPPHGGPSRLRPPHGAESQGGQSRSGEQSAVGPRGGPRSQRRLRDHSPDQHCMSGG